MPKAARLLLLCVPALCLAATVYRWVDADGVVHFSDQPQPGAVKIQIREPQSYTPGPAPKNQASKTPPAADTHSYTSCAVAVPADQATLMNADSVGISVQLEPGLQKGDQLIVALDGTTLAPPNATRYQVSPIDRGAHAVTATVRSADGNVLCESQPVNFYVHQPSVQAPKPH